jgi:predicted DNA-binding transcriptional regulator AlpA
MSTQTVKALRPPRAAEKLDCSLRALWDYAKSAEGFPQPVKLSPKVTVFFEHELDAWLQKRAEASRHQS